MGLMHGDGLDGHFENGFEFPDLVLQGNALFLERVRIGSQIVMKTHFMVQGSQFANRCVIGG